MQHEGQRFSGRLLAVRRSVAATRVEHRGLRREASRDGRVISPRNWAAAQYLFLCTSLPDCSLPSRVGILSPALANRTAFKRMKSLAGLGHSPKKDPASARAWLYGKLLVSLLAEHLMQTAKGFSPWGYPLPAPTQPLA